VLDSVLGKLARQHDPNVLVGFDTADDAGVYQLTAELALVQTVDFFTPIVDDAYVFGQIAATNALSDVYAMGGRPISALALVCFPDGGDPKTLEEMLAGGLSKMVEAGCTIIGGHSIRDEEIKLGYSVTGTIHPQKVLANKGAQAGDRLIFTKAIGTGVISTAIKRGDADLTWIRAAVRSMTTLNKAAAEVITSGGFGVHSLTDVTGFGLIGHAREMAIASGVSLRIEAARVPLLPGALECVRRGYVPGGLKANRQFAEGCVETAKGVAQDVVTLLYDPQTAGGLLIAVAASDAERLVAELQNVCVEAVEIGEVVPKQRPLIVVAKSNPAS
jgi:selenide,water dikinase